MGLFSMSKKTPISESHLVELQQAKALLENPGLTAKITGLIGTPIEKGIELLPKDWQSKINNATKSALNASLKGALFTMGSTNVDGTNMDGKVIDASPMWHKFATTLSGGVGGAFGLPALIVELPISTTIVMRSIADIARANGEDISTPQTQMSCLEVFAFGGLAKSDDASESGYFSARTAMARAVTEAADYLIEKTIAEEGAPALVRLIALIAARFEIQVSEKVAAMAIPIIGAVGGAGINLLFINHFQDMSRGHFCVRRLERLYGTEQVRLAYESL